MHMSGRKMQVWSNNEAIQEYRDLLAGKREDETNDGLDPRSYIPSGLTD